MAPRYMAVDQYGEAHHGLTHPRRDLLERLSRKHADKMFIDTADGTKHVGYVIAGRRLTVYKVTAWEGGGRCGKLRPEPGPYSGPYFRTIINTGGHTSSLMWSEKSPDVVRVVGVITHSTEYNLDDLLEALSCLKRRREELS